MRCRSIGYGSRCGIYRASTTLAGDADLPGIGQMPIGDRVPGGATDAAQVGDAVWSDWQAGVSRLTICLARSARVEEFGRKEVEQTASAALPTNVASGFLPVVQVSRLEVLRCPRGGQSRSVATSTRPPARGGREAQPSGKPPLAMAGVPRLPRPVSSPPCPGAVHLATPFSLVSGPCRIRVRPAPAANPLQASIVNRRPPPLDPGPGARPASELRTGSGWPGLSRRHCQEAVDTVRILVGPHDFALRVDRIRLGPERAGTSIGT